MTVAQMPHRVRWLAGVQFVVAVASVGAVAAIENGLEVGVYPACVVLTALAIWHVWSWISATGTLVNPYGFFLVALLVFNTGQVVLEVAGLNAGGLLGGVFQPSIVVRAVALTAASLSCLHAGALVGRILSATAAVHCAPDRAVATRRIGWFLLAVSAVPVFASSIAAFDVALSSGYAALYQRSTATGVAATGEVLALFLVPGLCFLLAGASTTRSTKAVVVCVAGVYFASQLVLGYRSHAALPLIALTWLWDRQVCRIPRRVIVVASLIVCLLFPVVRLTRLLAGGDRIDSLRLEYLADQVGNPILNLLEETGSTLAVAAYSLELVPAERAYDKGWGYAYAASTVFPNLFWDLHPAVAQGRYTDWLVRRVNPWVAERGGSLGFSIVAEAYVNFGALGGPVFLGLVGFAFSYFAGRSEAGDVARMAACAAFLAFWLFVARGETGAMVRPLVWYSLVPYGLVVALSTRKHGRVSPRPLPRTRAVALPARECESPL
jgi:hypothetical protein